MNKTLVIQDAYIVYSWLSNAMPIVISVYKKYVSFKRLKFQLLLLSVSYLTIRPVALEGEGSNCFSITQLVGQKRQ